MAIAKDNSGEMQELQTSENVQAQDLQDTEEDTLDGVEDYDVVDDEDVEDDGEVVTSDSPVISEILDDAKDELSDASGEGEVISPEEPAETSEARNDSPFP